MQIAKPSSRINRYSLVGRSIYFILISNFLNSARHLMVADELTCGKPYHHHLVVSMRYAK